MARAAPRIYHASTFNRALQQLVSEQEPGSHFASLRRQRPCWRQHSEKHRAVATQSHVWSSDSRLTRSEETRIRESSEAAAGI